MIDAQQGAFTSAESHFRTAITLAPRSPGPYENLGRLYQERSAADPQARGKAIRTYESLVCRRPREHRRSVSARVPAGSLPDSFANRARLLDRSAARCSRRGRRSSPCCAAALAGLSDDPRRGDARDARAASRADRGRRSLHSSGFDHIKDRHRVRAGCSKRSIDAVWRTPRRLQALGHLDASEGRYAESRAVLERAAASGVSVPLLLDLARAAFKAGDGEGALGYLAHARSLEPNNAAVHFMFGIICVELNLSGEAYESLKKAIALDPDNPRINYVLGAVSTHRPDRSEAIPYFEKYVALMPADPRGLFALGAAYFYSNQFEQARLTLQKAAARKETAAGAHYFLARIARQSNDLETARREVTPALQAYPEVRGRVGRTRIDSDSHRAIRGGGAVARAKRWLSIPINYVANVNLATLYSRTKDPAARGAGDTTARAAREASRAGAGVLAHHPGGTLRKDDRTRTNAEMAMNDERRETECVSALCVRHGAGSIALTVGELDAQTAARRGQCPPPIRASPRPRARCRLVTPRRH